MATNWQIRDRFQHRWEVHKILRGGMDIAVYDHEHRVGYAAKTFHKALITRTVLRRHLKAGEPVSVLVPRPIVSLADISQLRVRAEVDERDLGRIHLGQQVVVLADAFPGRRFAGRVSRPGAQMGRKKVRTGDPAEKSDRDVLEVLVDLEEIDERLVVGLRTTVQFLAK
jgi:hypothetical protein